MAVLSNNGRLISSLPLASQVIGTDELLIQSNGLTKRLPYSAFTSSILSPTKFNPYGSTVNFSNNNNKFTGSFYSINNKLANFAVVNVRQGITVAGLSTLDTVVGNLFNGNFLGFLSGDVTGNLIGKVNGQLTGSMLGNITGSIYSTGKSTFNNIDVNGGTIDGTSIGDSSQSTIKGTRISASVGFKGGLTGSLRGDIYTQNGNKVLENGTNSNPNGNVPSAFFYGTSSYGIQALTAAYALAGGGAAVNGLPTGGTQYQILAKSSVTDYATIWTSPITASTPGNNNYLAVWSGAKSLQNLNNFYYAGTDWICTTPFSVTNTLTVTGKVIAQSFTGSFNGGPGGFKKQGTKYVSFWGTGSHAVTASYVSSIAPVVNTSTGTVSNFLAGTNEGGVGTYCYAITHGFGVAPSSIRATLYCNSDDAGPGYTAGDEVDLNVVESDQLDANIFSTWTNSTYAAVSTAGSTGYPNNLYIPAKTGGTWNAIDSTKWKIKIRVWN